MTIDKNSLELRRFKSAPKPIELATEGRVKQQT